MPPRACWSSAVADVGASVSVRDAPAGMPPWPRGRELVAAHRARVSDRVSGTCERGAPKPSPSKMQASLPSTTRMLNALSPCALCEHSRLLPAGEVDAEREVEGHKAG